MSRRAIFRPEARAEMLEAYRWYQKQRRGLGGEFQSEVDKVIAKILAAPERYPQVYEDVREALVRRFPYAMYYVAEATKVVIIAIFDARRDPLRWQSRV